MNNWEDILSSRQKVGGKDVAQNVLQAFMNCYNASNTLREKYFRCKRFVAGDQWSDTVKVNGVTMTEKELLDSQGKYAVVNNFLKIFIRNYVGCYVKQDIEATCAARGGARQVLADILSVLLQYDWDINSQKELNAAVLENGLIAPCFVAKVGIGIKDGVYDVWTDFVDFPHFIIDPNAKDPRGNDVTMVGEIHDMTREQVMSSFARGKADRTRIANIYNNSTRRSELLNTYRNFGQIKDTTDFLFPEPGLCRVYEIWTLEHRDGYYCIDYLTADGYTIGEDEKAEIDAENERRIQQAREVGVSEDEITLAINIASGKKKYEGEPMPLSCKLIKTTYYYEDYWYYRFVAPSGEVIDEGESPYAHRSHPYVFRFYPMLGGDARSVVEDILDLQKDINRMDTMYDWIMRHSAKGALLVPSEQVDEEHGWTLERMGRAWAQPDAVIPYKAKAGFPKPEQVSANNTNIGLSQRIATKMDWIQQIIGIQGPLQGRSSFAGQSGTLYSQQVEQGTTSLLPLLNTFSGWTKELVRKQVRCIQQCYPEDKILDICAEQGFDKLTLADAKDARSMDFFVRINESPSSASYRDHINGKLDLFLQMGLIDRDIYLRNTTLPFDWRLRRDIEAQAAAAQAQGQQPLPSAIPQQASEAAIAGANDPQAGANNLYNTMHKK